MYSAYFAIADHAEPWLSKQTYAKESLIAWSMSKFASSRINIVGKYMYWSMVAISAPVCKCTSIYNLSSANTRAASARFMRFLPLRSFSYRNQNQCWNDVVGLDEVGQMMRGSRIRRRIYITFKDDSVVTFHQLRAAANVIHTEKLQWNSNFHRLRN